MLPDPTSSRSRRVGAAIAGVVVVAAGLAVSELAPPGSVSDAAGDALYAALIHLIAVFLAPRAARWKPALGALAWCIAIELFQLTGLPEAWGAAWRPAMFVFGNVFAASDLLFYALGVALVYGISQLAGWVVVVAYTKVPIWISLAVAVSVAAGLYPSVKAARLEPLETLRLG